MTKARILVFFVVTTLALAVYAVGCGSAATSSSSTDTAASATIPTQIDAQSSVK